MSRPKYTPEQRIIAFWNKVAITANDDLCWEWQAGKTSKGYGSVNRGGFYGVASRIAWEYFNGEIPPKIEVCHKCDNPGCVNPKHLFLGTHKDNVQDMHKKGRANRKRGEENGIPKLTEDKVRYIRNRYAQGDISLRALAQEMGIGKTTARSIVHFLKWKHVR